MRMKVGFSLVVVAMLSACTAYVPAQRVRVDGHNVQIDPVNGYHDGHHEGHGDGRFCPPGQAKKGRC